MVRRSSYTKVKKQNRIRELHVKGMGDVIFKGFQCLNSKCQHFIFVKKDDIGDPFEIICPICCYALKSGEVTKFFDYELIDKKLGKILEKGEFSILHDDYLEESQEYKICIICNTIKPITFFDLHSSRKSGKQGECKLCKHLYNTIKNPTRLSDQHREAAQKRRMYLDLAGGEKIDSKKILERFHYKCFKCGKDLSNCQSEKERPIDHTLPIFYLWPYTTKNATLLCQDHNGKKQGLWPSAFYEDAKLKELSILTGLNFKLISGPPVYNPEGIKKLQHPTIVDNLLKKNSRYFDEIVTLRNRIKNDVGLDFFEYSTILSADHKKRANDRFDKTYGKRLKKR